MILKADTGELVLFVSQGKGPKVRHHLVCLGRKRHYRKDGMCRHLEGFLARMKPWHRSRTEVTLWGNETP
jgi:hypothetical protein